VLGRFDGLHVGYDLSPKVHLNAVTGFPVDLSNKDEIQTETVFFGLNTEFEDVIKNLDLIPYATVQQSEGLLDRAAIGGEVRFFDRRGNIFNLTDYDVSYQSLNIFLLHGQLNLSRTSSLYFNLDYRNSPLIFTRNALINQTGVTRLEQLEEDFTEDEIRQQAEDRTGKSSIVTLGGSHSFTEDVQLSGDLTWTQQEYSTQTVSSSPGLAATEDSLLYNLRMTTTGIIGVRDITIFGFGYTDAETYDNTAFTFQNRAPFGTGWQFGSRLRVDLRSDTNGQELQRLRPSVTLNYRWKRSLNIDAEVGVEVSDYSGETNNQDTKRTFGNIGYRWMF
jgi:hypothetical protein